MMLRKSLFVLIAAALLSACAVQPTSTAVTAEAITASPPPIDTVYPSPTGAAVQPTDQPVYPYPAPQELLAPTADGQVPGLPMSTRYGIPAVDGVLAALFAGPDSLSPFFSYSEAPCTDREGLGGPPKCAPGQTKGEAVEGIPVLGSEGQFLPREDFTWARDPSSLVLLGVFKVNEGFQAEAYYPAGLYGIVLAQADESLYIVLRVSEQGIVRVDYPAAIPGKEQPDLEAYLEPLP